MTITSRFYDTTPGNGIKETEWAASAVSRGSVYGVAGANGLMLTPHPSSAYTLNIGPALEGFWGHGVWDTSDALVTLPAVTPPASGATRWDMVSAYRDWQPTGGGPTSLRVVEGTSARTLPASRANDPGVEDDQPLWLVQWTGGQTQPTATVDLRVWASNGGMSIADELALSYLAQPSARVLHGANEWAYSRDSNGVFGWSLRNALPSKTTLQPASGSKALSGFAFPQIREIVPGYAVVEGVFVPGSPKEGTHLVIPPSLAHLGPLGRERLGCTFRTDTGGNGTALAEVRSPSGTEIYIDFYGLPSNTAYVTTGFGWFTK